MTAQGPQTAHGRLTDKVTLVTGGGSGIGEAIVRRFAAEGAAVLVMDRDEARGGARGRRHPPRGALRGRRHRPAASEAAVERAVSEFGALHAAANNAGISGPITPIQDYPIEDWRAVSSVNLDGMFFCLRAQLRDMLANGGGSIVNMASIYSVVGRASDARLRRVQARRARPHQGGRARRRDERRPRQRRRARDDPDAAARSDAGRGREGRARRAQPHEAPGGVRRGRTSAPAAQTDRRS